jgi:hypothetical protein
MGGLSAGGGWGRLRATWEAEPLLTLAILAALVAIATTPLAFAVLGRTKWFEARRGRVMLRPSFWSVVCSMMLVMGIPAIFAALALKSRSFDSDRYEFDPNRTLSVLDQGRQYRTLKEADDAVRAERVILERERKDLVNAVKKVDEAMLPLRAAAARDQAAAKALNGVLDKFADVHKAIGLDAPQQLIVATAPPAEMIVAVPPGSNVPMMMMMPAPGVAATGASAPAPVAAAPVATTGLDPATAAAELATVAEPQKALAALLPLSGFPAGWVLGEQGGSHLEAFNADNLYEKINGRAESFLQYGVRGMAYCNYHPTDDDALEVQLYIFDMGDAIKAFGKYGSEKPEEIEPAEVGKDAYTAAGSVFFHAGRYYVQAVTASDDERSKAFALDIARRVDANIAGKPLPPAGAAGATAPSVAAAAPMPAPAGPTAEEEVTPDMLFKLLPDGPGRGGEKYVAQDVFGFSFLSDVFLADFKEGDTQWQGFVRPYPDAEKAKEILARYEREAKDLGATVEVLEAEGADRMLRASVDGLTDVFFLKGNTVAGANGATDAKPAEAFARAMAKSLPAKTPALPESEPAAAAGSSEGGEGGGESP